jgi:hypothetical protein
MNTVPILDCIKCQNPLTMKEMKVKAHYCEPCRRIEEHNAHQEQLSNQIHRANRVMK